MLIHSVTPPELLMEQTTLPATTIKQTKFGYLEGTETPKGFEMSRLISTDLSLYLREEFRPGSIYRDEAAAQYQGR